MWRNDRRSLRKCQFSIGGATSSALGDVRRTEPGTKEQENQSRSKDRYLSLWLKSLQTKQMTAGELRSHWSYTFSRQVKGNTLGRQVKGKLLAAASISYEISLKMEHMFRIRGRWGRISLVIPRRTAYI